MDWSIDQTLIQKSRNGWQAESIITLGEAKDTHGEPAKRKLTIHTWKRSRGGIYTNASCSIHGNGFTQHALFADYSKTVAELAGVKCTEKSVKTLHATVMAQQADAILAEARAFYEAKDAAKALNAKRDAELKAADEARRQADLAEARVPA